VTLRPATTTHPSNVQLSDKRMLEGSDAAACDRHSNNSAEHCWWSRLSRLVFLVEATNSHSPTPAELQW
jgi:hypothetical protein